MPGSLTTSAPVSCEVVVGVNGVVAPTQVLELPVSTRRLTTEIWLDVPVYYNLYPLTNCRRATDIDLDKYSSVINTRYRIQKCSTYRCCIGYSAVCDGQ